ncbi:hypothetical protein [Bradyrhizobium sp. BR 10261]|uniref:hypothetical protein n=1 Tax=Bradyrhizobium sp. BR 10261 TaxID=2749992 RepID=UPI001C64A3AE|nr:hypothetical protein [Bradyrhizobium sp. BR 10261]MBW7966777.1 hypothetical protein [Bradyrhizobium sp. BR 10261]
MMDRQRGKILFECDSCDEVLHTDAREFDEAREQLRSEGWYVRKICGEWMHGCPNCGAPS